MGNGKIELIRRLVISTLSLQSKRLTENQLLDPDMIKILFEED